MVFDGFRSMFKGKSRDAFDPRGMESFSPEQRDRIISKIRNKEIELMGDKAERFAEERIARLEKVMGLKSPDSELRGRKGFRAQRLGNIERQKQRTARFKKNEKDFRDGKLKVKPVGPRPIELKKKLNTKLQMKPIKLRAPSSTLK